MYIYIYLYINIYVCISTLVINTILITNVIIYNNLLYYLVNGDQRHRLKLPNLAETRDNNALRLASYDRFPARFFHAPLFGTRAWRCI